MIRKQLNLSSRLMHNRQTPCHRLTSVRPSDEGCKGLSHEQMCSARNISCAKVFLVSTTRIINEAILWWDHQAFVGEQNITADDREVERATLAVNKLLWRGFPS